VRAGEVCDEVRVPVLGDSSDQFRCPLGPILGDPIQFGLGDADELDEVDAAVDGIDSADLRVRTRYIARLLSELIAQMQSSGPSARTFIVIS
jgi:hypothetical protein